MPIALLGVPWDATSSYQRGPAQAPAAIRAALRNDSTNGWNEAGQDVRALLQDAGDLTLPADGPLPLDAITTGLSRLLDAGTTPISLGGDHAITWPLVRAVRPRHERLTVFHLDAHPDLYDELDGRKDSHACPMARLLEEGNASHLVQCGIRTMNGHQRAQARRFGVEVVEMRQGLEAMVTAARRLAGAVYLSVDLDALDPACAPGLSHPEPGGLTTRELLTILQAIPKGRLVAADVVELNPANDLRDLTARVAAKVIGEIVGRM